MTQEMQDQLRTAATAALTDMHGQYVLVGPLTLLGLLDDLAEATALLHRIGGRLQYLSDPDARTVMAWVDAYCAGHEHPLRDRPVRAPGARIRRLSQ